MAKDDEQQHETREILTAAVTGGSDVLVSLIENFGWPGAVAIIVLYRLDGWASAAQKEKLVEIYLLGNGLGNVWPILVTGLIFAVTVLAQKRRYDKRLEVRDKEIARIGAEKSTLQEQLAGRPLQHIPRLK